MPELARTPCYIPRLTEAATEFDLEVVYVARGAAIIACDAARDLAVQTHAAEHEDEDVWLERQRPRSIIDRLFRRAGTAEARHR